MSFEYDVEHAVKQAIDKGMTPTEFVQFLWEVWTNVLRDKGHMADHAFERLLKK